MTAGARAWWRRPLGQVVLAALVVGGLAAAWYVAAPAVEARWWHAKLVSGDDEQAPLAASKLAHLGPAGVPALVAGLNSDRPAVALACKRAMVESLTRLESAPASAADAYRLALAQTLDEQTPAFSPAARTAAGDLALRLLTMRSNSDNPASDQLTALCDRVLRAKLGQAETPLDAAGHHARHASITAMLAQPHLCRSVPEPDGLRRPKLEPIADRLALLEHDEPGLLAAPADARPISALASIDYGETSKPAARPVVDPQVRTASAVVDAGELNRLAQLPGIELLKLLAHGGEFDHAAIEAEIKRRKFSPRELELGRHLVSPRADERARWAEALPGTSGIDAKPWLLWLSRDPSPQVRLAVVTLIATASDPELRARVLEMARSDRDERVQSQAARIVEQAADN